MGQQKPIVQEPQRPARRSGFIDNGEHACFVCRSQHSSSTRWICGSNSHNSREGACDLEYKMFRAMYEALENRTRVHAVYTFGEVDLFHTFTGLEKQRREIAKRNIPAVFFSGNVPLPGLSLLPIRSTKMISAISRPILLPQLPAGQKHTTKKNIAQACQIYERALFALFEEFKSEVGMADRSLEILTESK